MKTIHPFVKSLNEMKKEFNELKLLINTKEVFPNEHRILNNDEVLKFFNISAKTAQKWRDEGILKYFKIKGRIYYRLSDINSLIDDYSALSEN